MESSLPPVIDLNANNALELIGHACKSWGVFQVVNHNVRKDLIDETEAASKRLFALPMEQKLKAERSQGQGPAGYGTPPISLVNREMVGPEGFTIVGSPLEHARLLWPADYQASLGDVIDEYSQEMNTLAVRLLQLMIGSLGITEEDIEWSAPGGFSLLQLNSYNPCPDPNHGIGLVGHTDSSLFTILHQKITSLQVKPEGSGWVTVPPLQDALVVIVGDLFSILSNGVFRSVFHQTLGNPTQNRITICFFYGPPSDIQVSPSAKLLDSSHPPLYRPITWSDYRIIKYKYFNEALNNVRV